MAVTYALRCFNAFAAVKYIHWPEFQLIGFAEVISCTKWSLVVYLLPAWTAIFGLLLTLLYITLFTIT